MKGIVWGLTFERANEKLTEIVEKYLQMEYHIIAPIDFLSSHYYCA